MLPLRWTERAVAHLEAIVEYISVTSPVYAEGVVLRIEQRLQLARAHAQKLAANRWRLFGCDLARRSDLPASSFRQSVGGCKLAGLVRFDWNNRNGTYPANQ